MRRKMASQQVPETHEQRPIFEPVPDAGGEMSLSDIINLFKRHWFLMIAIIGAIVGGMFVYVSITPNVYTAQGQVHVNQSSITTSQNAIVRTDDAQITDVPNEVALLRSRVIASGVIRELNLEEDPEFVSAEDVAELAPERRMDLLIDEFLGHLSVSANPDTRLINITFESRDPAKAALIVNTLMERYVANQIETQRSVVEGAIDLLQDEVDKLEAEVADSDAAVRAYRRESGIVQGNSLTDITAEKVSDLSRQLAQAQSDQAAIRAELQQLEAALRRDGNAFTAPRVLNSPLIQNLRDKEVELVRRLAQLSSVYLEKHPRMIEVTQELEDVRDNIKNEVDKIVLSMRSEVAAAGARVNSLRASLAEVEATAVSTRGSEDELAELVREGQDRRAMLQTFRVRLRETQAQRDLIEPRARVHSPAEVPGKPSFPQKGKMMGLAGFMGSILAAVVVMVIGAMRRTFESPEEIERLTGYRALGIVPKMAGVAGGRRTAQRILQNYTSKSNATFAQAMKGIRSTLFLANGSKPPKTVLITSALPGEGKTTFSLAYATLCATMGERTILIDCDFGRPDLHKKMDVANDLGISNYLMGEVDLDVVLRKDMRTGMDYIVSGTLPPNATELSRSAQLRDLLESLSWEYDVVVIDSAPVLAMSDSQLFSTMVDATIFVVRWRATRTESVLAAVNRLEDVGSNSVAGFVMSNVSVPKTKSTAVSGYYAAYHR